MRFCDIHSHLNFKDYSDLDDVVARMNESETGTIIVGTNFESSTRALELAGKYENTWACVGIHPTDDMALGWEAHEFSKLVRHPKVVAIGECGMDFYHTKKEKDYERQKELFLTQIEFALEHNKPIMIHARNSYNEILEILESIYPRELGRRELKGNVHFFAGDVGTAERFFKIGFTISFTGVITFTREYDDVIKSVPLDMIHAETDAPFVAPVPYRGKRNEPSYVCEVVKKIAEIRGENFDHVKKTLINNVFRVFGVGK